VSSPAPEEPRISYVVARLDRALRRAIGARMRPFGLTTLQYTTLSVIGRRDGLSISQLARRSYMSRQAMSEVIEVLEQRGLIERSPHPSHRRILPAALTEQGRDVLAACEAAVDEVEAEMLSGLSPAQRAALQEGLYSAVHGLQAGLAEQHGAGTSAGPL
jgi:DNA-binding MarR family transcriptional regulator